MVTHKMSAQVFESEVLNANLTSVFSDDGEIYFKAQEIAMALGYTNTNKAIRDHVREGYKVKYDDIKGNVSLPLHPHTIFLIEPGFYEPIFSSKLPHAEAFQDWVFSEVLPSIRKTGSYTLRDPIDKLQNAGRPFAYTGDQRKE